MKGYECLLNCDLTRYHPGLTKGIKGNIVCHGTFGFLVNFPSINHTHDIISTSLDITDQRYIQKCQDEDDEFENSIKKMTDVVYYVGPREDLEICVIIT